MIENLSRQKRNIALGILACLILWFAWSIRSVLNPVILGYLCAFILTPAVVWIERRGFSRLTAVNLTFAAGFLGAGLLALVMSVQVIGLVSEIRQVGAGESQPSALAQAQQVSEETQQSNSSEAAEAALPLRPKSLRQRFEARLERFRGDLKDWELDAFLPESEAIYVGVKDLISDVQVDVFDEVGSGVRVFLAFLGRLAGLAGMFILLPLYAYYFLFVQKDLHDFTESCIPKSERERIMRVGGQIGEVVASFFRGRLSVSLIKGLLISVGLSLFGVDYAFLLGMTSGLLSVIPFVGPFLGFLVTFAIDVPMHLDEGFLGIVSHPILASFLRTALVFGIAELLEGYVLVPRILGDSLGLHPLVVFVALLAGGAALGMLGILIALPLTAVLVILFKEFVQPALRDFAEE